MNKNIVIIWGGNTSDRVSISDFSAPWTTDAGNTLHLVDIRNDSQAVFEYIDQHISGGEVLVFLHETPPHNYTESHRIDLINLFSDHQLVVRARVFGGGHGKLYCREYNLNGILGAKGRLARFIETTTRPIKNIQINLIESEPERRISQTHFDYVWNTYWVAPKDKLFDLLETFNWRARGFDWTNHTRQNFIQHLRSDNDLWQQLHAFAEMPQVDGEAISPAYADFSLKGFEYNLTEKQQAFLKKTRDGIKKVIKEGYFDSSNDSDTVSEVYNALFIIYNDIVQIDE